MRIRPQHQRRDSGIALLIVMIVIIGLSLLAMGFVMAMKVEVRLARHAQTQPDLDWLGRSGVELARYVLAQSMNNPDEPYDSLSQFWAGGPAGTNLWMSTVQLTDVQLGPGTINVEIRDLERKFNINIADQQILQQAMIVTAVDAAQSGTVISSIQDWIDPDDDTHIGGAESAYYLGLETPYAAKNGPLDDISELLLINGIGPALYWGPAGSGYVDQLAPNVLGADAFNTGVVHPVGLVDLFTTLSDARMNINTAGPQALQLIPGIDESRALAIITTRDGADGIPGTEDDMPFRGASDLQLVPGMDPALLQQIQTYGNTRSITFEVTVEARIGDFTRNYTAIIRRNSPRDLPILQYYWD